MKKYYSLRLKILNNNIPRSAQRPVEVLWKRLLLKGCCLVVLFIPSGNKVYGQCTSCPRASYGNPTAGYGYPTDGDLTYWVGAQSSSYLGAGNRSYISTIQAGTLSGTTPLCAGTTAAYTTNGTSGGSWSSTAPAVATVNSSTGVVTGVSAGTADIIYTKSRGCGSPVSSSKSLTVSSKVFLPVKTFLQGAYSTSLVRHKNVTTTWAAILNANALSQPYNLAPFSYSGTESVSAGFFTSTAATTDILDWVLVELRDATSPATLISRHAAFTREDGRIVELDGVSDVSFDNVVNGNYFMVIRHRNHLAIRTATVRTVDATMCNVVPAVYDFSSAQSQAFQNIAITTNPAQRDLTGGVFGMWGGNGNSDGFVRATGLASQNDFLFLLNAMGFNPANIINNVYNKADLNLDGIVRATGLTSINDYLFLLSALDSNPAKIVSQH